MGVVMIKHTPGGKVFWFEVPEHLSNKIGNGVRVFCDTSRGVKSGIAVSDVLDADDVKDVMTASGAVFPLRKIVSIWRQIPLERIKVPSYIAHSKPRDEKIAKRFLEFYHTGAFQTNVVVDDEWNLRDGYTAYLVAKKMGAQYLSAAIVKKDSK